MFKIARYTLILAIGCLLTVSCSQSNNESDSNTDGNSAPSYSESDTLNPSTNEVPLGAQNLEDIGHNVIDALKVNDFQKLSPILPTQDIISQAHVGTSKDTAVTSINVLSLSPQEILFNLQSDFNKVAEEIKKVTGNSAHITEQGPLVNNTKITDAGINTGNVQIPILFNSTRKLLEVGASQINGRWFLTGPIQLTD